jgi:hypothetical protein
MVTYTIKQVFVLTMNNASNNAKMLKSLKLKLPDNAMASSKTCVFCILHILNLVCQVCSLNNDLSIANSHHRLPFL